MHLAQTYMVLQPFDGSRIAGGRILFSALAVLLASPAQKLAFGSEGGDNRANSGSQLKLYHREVPDDV